MKRALIILAALLIMSGPALAIDAEGLAALPSLGERNGKIVNPVIIHRGDTPHGKVTVSARRTLACRYPHDAIGANPRADSDDSRFCLSLPPEAFSSDGHLFYGRRDDDVKALCVRLTPAYVSGNQNGCLWVAVQ